VPFSADRRTSLNRRVGRPECGQAESATDVNNFAENGFTHLDLSAGLLISAGVLSITPVLHFLINGDDVTKFTSPATRATRSCGAA
jgi:hypothetical protein